MTDLLYAVHRLGVSDPHVEMVATGEWNADGSPVMKKSVKRIDAGTLFPAALLEGGAAEVQRLIGLGAVRYPDAIEISQFEREQAEG